MKKFIRFITLSSLMLFSASLFAQEALKSLEEEYYDFLSLTGVTERPTLGYRTLSDSVWHISEEDSEQNIWKNKNLGTTYTLWAPKKQFDNWFMRGLNKQGVTARIYGPEWYTSFNTKAPYGQNDGALWQGKGFNTSLTGGIRFESYGFELTFKPQFSLSQNMDYDINSAVYPNIYSNTFASGSVYHPIDYVQRYGSNSFWTFDLGDTEARWSWNSLTFGMGTQNPWLGPAYLNPMLGSNNAPGYLKIDAGLRKTNVLIPFTDLSLGYIEGRIWMGQLVESEYFDSNPDNNKRLVTGLSASYSPSFIPGFTFGLNRIFLTYFKKENIKYLLRLFTLSRSNALASSGNDEDQKFSLFAEWNFPKVGFTVYGEFGRDDFSNDEKSNPFHTAIYTVGVKQVIPLPFAKIFHKLPEVFNLTSEVNFEWNNFEMSQDFQMQWTYMGYYAHGFVTQGYTHKGQILGAGSGFAGNSQFFQYKILFPIGSLGYSFHRYCPNNNSVYSQAVYSSATNPHTNSYVYNAWYPNFETYLCNSILIDLFIEKGFSVSLDLSYIKITHRNYNPSIGPSEKTIHGSFTIKYTF